MSRPRRAAFRRGLVKGLVNQDFRHLSHLVESGRAKYDAAIVLAVVPLLQSWQTQAAD